jgi:hypothetical protein
MNPVVPMAAYPDLAFRDGSSLRQVASLSALGPGRYYVDQAADRLWINDDHAGRLVAAALSVDDWTQRRSASAMGVTSDGKTFWLPLQAGTRLTPPTDAGGVRFRSGPAGNATW